MNLYLLTDLSFDSEATKNWEPLRKTRPLSAPFLFRTSGKGTDMVTPLGPEKYGRIDFSLGRWTTMGQNAPKLVLKHAKEQVELVRIFLRSLLRPQESLF